MKLAIFSLFLFFFKISSSFSEGSPFLVQPTGSFGVGYQDVFVMNDKICPDKFYKKNRNESDFSLNNPNHCHEIILRIFYPSSTAPSLGSRYYAPAFRGTIRYISTALKMSKKEEEEMEPLFGIQTYSTSNKPVSNLGKFPLVVFVPGSGMSVHSYMNLISEVVSRGYIVLGLNSLFANGPLELKSGYLVMPPGEYIDAGRLQNLDDLQLVLEKIRSLPFDESLKKQMDFEKIALMGHSMGAMSIVNLLKKLPLSNVKAILLMDPGNILETANYPIQLKGIPLMMMWSSKFKDLLRGSTVLDSNQFELIMDGNHQNFSDFSTLQYHPVLKRPSIRSFLVDSKNLGVGMNDGYELSQVIFTYSVSFLGQYLKDQENHLTSSCHSEKRKVVLSCRKAT